MSLRGIAAGAFLLAVLAYLPALSYAPIWDDRFLTTENPNLASWAGLWRCVTTDLWHASASNEASEFYRPLTLLSYAASRALFGNTAAGYRAASVLLHGANAALLVLVAARVSGAEAARPSSRLGPLAAGVVFALAPLHVEAVVWLAGRFDVLGTTCALAAWWANGSHAKRRRTLTWLAGTAALFAKEAVIVAVVLVALDDALVLRRPLRAERGKLLALGASIVAFFALRAAVGVHSAGAARGLGPGALLASYAFALETYGRLFVWPSELDPFRVYAAPGLALVIGAVLGVGTLAAVVVARLRRPAARPLDGALFGACVFAAACAPIALTGPKLGMVGDRYGYLPSVGLALALASALVVCTLHIRPWALAVALAGAALADGVALRHRSLAWRDERTLYETSLAAHPANPFAQYFVGALDAQEGRLTEAKPLLEAARAHEPQNFRVLNALCFVHLREGDLVTAEARCLDAVTANPRNVRSWTNLASVYLNGRRFPEAAAASSRALALKPNDPEPLYVRAAARANLGDLAGAEVDVARALAAAPGHAGALSLAAQLAARRGKP